LSSEKKTANSVKSRLKDLLELSDSEKMLDEISRLPSGRVVNALFPLICSSDEETKWKAVAAMGVAVSEIAKTDMEAARVVMRKLMWSLNDESGGAGWGAPEAMAEIMARNENLAAEYAHVLVSYIRPDGNYLEFEPLLRGAIWGIGRLAQVRPQLAHDAADYLAQFLESNDATTRGLAAWALGLVGAEKAGAALEKLLEDDSAIKIYLNQKLVSFKVKELAGKAFKSGRKAKSLAGLM